MDYELKRMNIELSSHCNYRCVGCPSSDDRLLRGKGHMDLELFKKISRQMKNSLEKTYLWNYGEPLLNPEIEKILDTVGKISAETILSTNGALIEDFEDLKFLLNLDKLIISFNGLDRETYNYHQKGDFDKAVRGLEKAVKITRDSDTEMVLQMVVNKKNLEQKEEFFKYSKNVGADKAVLKSFNNMSGEKTIEEQFIPEDERYSRKKGGRPDYLPCLESMVVNWDGTVVPCCWDYKGEHLLGNIRNNDLYEVWNSNRFKKFRENIKRRELDICSDCSIETTIEEKDFRK